MKKIIALLLVLVLVLGAFAGCSPAEKDVSSNPSESGEGSGNEGGESGFEAIEIPSYRMGILLENPIKLISLFMGSEPTGEAPDIKNIALDLMADMENSKAAMSLGADMFGQNYGLNLFANDKNLVVNAPGLYDKAYGMTMEELMTLYTELMNQMASGMDDSMMAPEEGATGAVGMTSIFSLLSDNKEALTTMFEKYSELIVTEFNANVKTEEVTEGSNVVTTYTLDSDAIAAIAASMVYTFVNDAETQALLEALGVDTSMDYDENTSKEDLLAEAKEAYADMGVKVVAKVTTDVSKEDVLAVDLDFLIDDAPFATFDYDAATGTFTAVIDENATDTDKITITGKIENGTTTVKIVEIISYGDGNGYTNTTTITFGDTGFSLTSKEESSDGYTDTLELSLTIAETSASFRVYQSSKNPEEWAEYDYESEFNASLTWSDTGFTVKLNVDGTETVLTVTDKDGKLEGKLTIAGEEMGTITFDSKVEGKKHTYTLKSLTYGEVSIDFSDVGLSFIFETDVTVPDAPASYESLADMDEAALQTLLQDIMTKNQDLLSQLGLAG